MDWPLPIRILLLPFSWIYGLAARLRALLYAKGVFKTSRLKAPVVSVGNLTVGGTGKTPMVLWLAEKFSSEGKRVGILSRGYRGTGETSDEIELLKNKLGDRVVFGVDADRFAAGRKIEAEHPVDVFLLDDGFQYLALARDIDIVLVDSTRPLHQEHVLPAGRLREPVSAIARAGVVVFTRVEQAARVVPAIQKFPKLPIFSGSTRLIGFRLLAGSQELLGAATLPQPVFAFCGIGNPGAFLADLARWGVEVAGRKIFRDHHRYSEEDGREIEKLANSVGAKALVTTEKDLQNLRGVNFTLPAYCCATRMEIPDEGQFWKLILQALPATAKAAS
jgi:tetraacyldisaccharide 4'-kinase